MRYYEHVFLLRQDLGPAQVDSVIDDLKKVVEERGGKVSKVEKWGLRPLAYRIGKNRKAHYVLFNLETPPEAVEELERIERISDDVIRFLTVRVEELEKGPSVMMREQERGARRRGAR